MIRSMPHLAEKKQVKSAKCNILFCTSLNSGFSHFDFFCVGVYFFYPTEERISFIISKWSSALILRFCSIITLFFYIYLLYTKGYHFIYFYMVKQKTWHTLLSFIKICKYDTLSNKYYRVNISHIPTGLFTNNSWYMYLVTH